MNKRLSKALGAVFLLTELALVPKAIELMLNRHFSELSPLGIITLAMTFSSIGLCILMSYSSMSDHDSYPLPTFLFELAVFMCCLAPMTDLLTKALDSAGRPGLNLLVNTVYYLIGINVAYVIMRYEFVLIGAGRREPLRRLGRWAAVLMLLDNLATLLNIPFGFFFTISEGGAYQSAPLFWLAYLAPMLIVALTVYAAAREMRPGRARRAFLFFWIFAGFFSLLQGWREELTLQYTGYTLTLIVLYMNVQSELAPPGSYIPDQEVM